MWAGRDVPGRRSWPDMFGSIGEQPELGRRRVRDLFADVAAGLGPHADLPEDVTIRFDLQGEGGGVFTIRREDGVLGLVSNDPIPLDCHLRCSVDDFLALLQGRLDSRRGFLEGRLEVEGDVGLVLRLERALTRNIQD